MLTEIRFKITKLILSSGKCPFDDWFESLPSEEKYLVSVRLTRVELGNFGDHKYLRDKVWELKFQSGAAFRIYYALRGKKVILLLGAGDKASQKKDIRVAKERLKLITQQ